MPRNLKSLDLRAKFQKGCRKLVSIWRQTNHHRSQIQSEAIGETRHAVHSLPGNETNLEVRGFAVSSTPFQIENQKGYTTIFALALMPVLLAGIVMIAYTQFYSQNWMESSHICRTELLKTQESVRKDLESLMKLNSLARSYRMALLAAKIQLAAGIATYNGALVARATAEIVRIQKLQKILDGTQKALIWKANVTMSAGLVSVRQKLQGQSSRIQARLPEFLGFRIHSIRSTPKQLAVKPDKADIAPVYELKANFKDEQALHVSWTSEFQTKQNSRYKWIQQRHQKKDSCSATLESDKTNFKTLLHAGKSF